MRKSFLLIILALNSCSPEDFTAPVNPEIPYTELIESSDLYPETDDAGEYIFYSNDSDFIQTYGMTFWATKLPVQPVFDQIDISLSKISGNKLTGYGVIFCHSLRGEPEKKTMLVFMINLNQEYIIGEVIDDLFSVLVPWTSYSGLYTGYNQENRIKIVFDPIGEEFQLYINNMDVVLMTFTDDDSPLHREGESGFITVISPLDTFPEVPVHIIFKNND